VSGLRQRIVLVLALAALLVSVAGIGSSLAQTGSLTTEEEDGILFMREEEKLARDVYITLGEQWGLKVFTNIQQSEQQHMDAVLVLIEQYGLDDPAATTDVGEFVDSELQALYDDLIARGEQSLIEAIAVGAWIEEADIVDLEEHIAQTDEAAIQRVYASLLKGSENHLVAFVRQWERTNGEDYAPIVIDQERLDSVISTGTQRGGNGGR
jgi:hypothetical protein